ncbi:hypothetical protein C0Q70_15793 [Pomacea canaliculata]|uniref:Uncharacterized protein n=1 Tax=Pomacea canaliculata TaxID=400727 RepID=A0A2T7NVV5_POMCA|nr:hypothetical protein C0Q70_15793 [Pomacea canaliculata]
MAQRVTDFVLFPVPVGGYVKVGLRLSALVGERAFTFWLILAGASAFTIVVLVVSYAVCRFRRPGCADVSLAQERFLVENVLGAQGRTRSHTVLKSSASDATTTAPSPTSASPDLLLEAPLTKGRPPGKEPGPGPVELPAALP